MRVLSFKLDDTKHAYVFVAEHDVRGEIAHERELERNLRGWAKAGGVRPNQRG